jgi:hypothetical protein
MSLLAGAIVSFSLAGTSLYKGYQASVNGTVVPFKAGWLTPDQEYVIAILSFALSAYLTIKWLKK